jgi:hypothetical protein
MPADRTLFLARLNALLDALFIQDFFARGDCSFVMREIHPVKPASARPRGVRSD